MIPIRSDSFMTLVLVLALATTAVLGCREQMDEDRKMMDAASSRMEALYDAFMTAPDPDEARRPLGEIISFLESEPLPARFRTHCLWLAYSRLYVLERRTGDADAAEAALGKARDWYRQRQQTAGATAAEAHADAESLIAEKIFDMMDRWDAKENDGRGPRYAWNLAGEDRAKE